MLYNSGHTGWTQQDYMFKINKGYVNSGVYAHIPGTKQQGAEVLEHSACAGCLFVTLPRQKLARKTPQLESKIASESMLRPLLVFMEIVFPGNCDTGNSRYQHYSWQSQVSITISEASWFA